jgi:hypothetical protein
MPWRIFLLFAFVGSIPMIAALGYAGWAYSQVSEARNWSEATARIRSADLEEVRSRDSDGDYSVIFRPRLTYEFAPGGRAVRGSRIWLTGSDFFNDSWAGERFLDEYAVGRTVQVHYDPDDPRRSALIVNGPPWWTWLFVAFSLFWLSATYYYRPWKAKKPPKPRFGTCRSCGARLAWNKHVAIDKVTPVEQTFYDNDNRPRRETRYDIEYRHSPCPRCNDRQPLNSIRNNPGGIIFLIVFVALFAAGSYFVFFLP